jgi:hypothetical protein
VSGSWWHFTIAAATTGVVACLAAACDTGPGILTGIGEPFRVSNGQFISGELPGSPPPEDAGVASASSDGSVPPLSVLNVGYTTRLIAPGESAKFNGDVSNDTVAVGARLDGLGTGYWVVPAGAPDISQPGTLTYSLSAGFDPNDPGGLRNLLVVAIGGSGQGGVQYATQLCFKPRIPDNGHACDPTVPLPDTVFTLQWDDPFDLDLHVKGPNGVDYNSREPYGGPVDAGPRGIPPGLPHIDRDSDGNCTPDGLNQEDLIFDDPPPPGKYTVYVDPFASCGQPSVRFKFTLYRASGTCPACAQVAITSVTGEILASQETGGTLVPLQIAQVNF